MYDSATTSLLELFTQRNVVAKFIRLNLIFSHTNDKLACLEPPFGGVRGKIREGNGSFATLFGPLFGEVRGNIRTSSIARWKARGRLPIRDN